MKVGIIGAGSWGSALSIHCGKLRDIESLKMWCYERELAQIIQEKGENPWYLPGFPLPEKLQVTSQPEDLTDRDLWIWVVPVQHSPRVMERFAPFYNHQPVICCSKGIECQSLAFLSDLFHKHFPSPIHHFVLSGPTFAREVAQGLPTAAVLAGEDEDILSKLQAFLSDDTLRIYRSKDKRGVEIAGALKNVMALACGMVVGLSLGHNALASLITRGLQEIIRLGIALGGKEETFYGLAGLGDLILTCTGDLSRNRRVGIRIGKGETLEEIVSSMKMVAEGVKTTEAAYQLAQIYQVEMPITEAVYRILYQQAIPKKMVKALMRRSLKEE